MPHGDLPNLLKYAFNLNLAGADSHTLIPGSGESGLPVIVSETSGGTIRLEFVRRIGSGLIYEPQKSPDLSEGSWAAVATTPTVLPIDGQWERVIIEEPLNAGTMRWFGRVRVTLPP